MCWNVVQKMFLYSCVMFWVNPPNSPKRNALWMAQQGKHEGLVTANSQLEMWIEGPDRGLCHPSYLGGKWVSDFTPSDLVAPNTLLEDSLDRFRPRWPEVRAEIHFPPCNFWWYTYTSIRLALYLHLQCGWLKTRPSAGDNNSFTVEETSLFW